MSNARKYARSDYYYQSYAILKPSTGRIQRNFFLLILLNINQGWKNHDLKKKSKKSGFFYLNQIFLI